MGVFYPSSISAVFCDELAWANIAADACDKMLYLANVVDSVATSTSMIRLFAASRFAEDNLR